MIPKKESIRLFMELQTLEERGIGIWMEGHISSPGAVTQALSVSEESAYMRDYIFEEGVLKKIQFDKVTNT